MKNLFRILIILLVTNLLILPAYAGGDGSGSGSGQGSVTGSGEELHSDGSTGETVTETPAPAEDVEPDLLTDSLTIHEIGELAGMRGGDVAEALGLSRSVDKDTPVSELGITTATLREHFALDPDTGESVADEHHEEDEATSTLKYIIFILITLFGVVWLWKLGIPRGADPKKRKGWYPERVYIIVLAISAIVLGFWLGKSPNPMESVVKVFKASVGIYPTILNYVIAMVFFLVLAWIGNKVVCGWACPFGAIEELIYMLPFFRKAKKWKLPFAVSNWIRGILFVVTFIVMTWVFLGKGTQFLFYHYLNPFNLFTFSFESWTFEFETGIVFWFIGVYLIVSFFFYRPYCRFICPFGFVSWLVEKFSLTRIKINTETCIDCRACEKVCPLTAAGDRLDGKSWPADCFACMRCLRVCPTDAIAWKGIWEKYGK